MMEAADQGRLDDLAFVESLHPSWLRGILRQRKVGAGPVVVDEVLAQQAAQMGFVQHHDVVETLAAEGADETFHVRILPRGPRRRLDFADSQGVNSAREHDPVDRIAVAQQGRPVRMRGIMPVIIDQTGRKSTLTRWTE
jgi:hypothetical protein